MTGFRLLRYFPIPKAFGITESASGGLMPLNPVILYTFLNIMEGNYEGDD